VSWFGALACALALFAHGGQHESSVGMPARIEELVLPGSELEAKPIDTKLPLVLRIAATHPHGSEFRYDLEFTGLEAGEYDLRDFMRRKDGSATDALPAIPVSVTTSLASGQIMPLPPEEGDHPALGGYRRLLIVGGAVWTLGLLTILFAGRRKRQRAAAALVRPRTLAERLRPLVERALAGQLSRAERSQLELSLVAYWRRKLGMEERRPEESLALLRQHAQAGPLLTSLEDWLHRPTPPANVDLGLLLAPYKDLPADALGDLHEKLAEART
jgi:hypothetical protein